MLKINNFVELSLFQDNSVFDSIKYAQNQTSIVTRDTRASLLQLEKTVLSIVKNY